MSDAEGQPEPTMEEILASIRRIISEDGEEVEESEVEAAEDEDDELVLEEPEEDFADLVEEEVLELEEEPEPEPEPELEPEPEPEPEPVLELVEEEPEEEVFELTEVLDEEEPEPLVLDEPEPLVLDEIIEEEPEPIYEAVPEYEPEPEPEPYVSGPAAMPSPDAEGLVSREAAEQTAAAFVGFASAVSSAQGVQLGASHRTLEELVKELLRPMLKDWLDRNLQPIVARTVEREIAKLAGRADED